MCGDYPGGGPEYRGGRGERQDLSRYNWRDGGSDDLYRGLGKDLVRDYGGGEFGNSRGSRRGSIDNHSRGEWNDDCGCRWRRHYARAGGREDGRGIAPELGWDRVAALRGSHHQVVVRRISLELTGAPVRGGGPVLYRVVRREYNGWLGRKNTYAVVVCVRVVKTKLVTTGRAVLRRSSVSSSFNHCLRSGPERACIAGYLVDGLILAVTTYVI